MSKPNIRPNLAQSKRWIVKIGSALLTKDGQGLDVESLQTWVKQITDIRTAGTEVVLVSSGAVAEGMSRMGWITRPSTLHGLQAAAAIGQMGLIQAYETAFRQYELQTAQILLTHDDLSNRRRYLNARSTLSTLLDHGVIPIVNENDTVAYDEIQLGDNDTLGALVANLLGADILVILTDQQGLFDKDPRYHSEAQLISEGHSNDPELLKFAGSAGTNIGTGGMRTKILAAERAARSGCSTIIAAGREDNILNRLYQGETLGTLLMANEKPLLARKQWLAGHLKSRGKLWLDAGAIEALTVFGKSLLSVGVVKTQGHFSRGDMVSCLNLDGQIIAQGLINYNHNETNKISGYSSQNIATLLGYVDESELIHRDNLVVLS